MGKEKFSIFVKILEVFFLYESEKYISIKNEVGKEKFSNLIAVNHFLLLPLKTCPAQAERQVCQEPESGQAEVPVPPSGLSAGPTKGHWGQATHFTGKTKETEK